MEGVRAEPVLEPRVRPSGRRLFLRGAQLAAVAIVAVVLVAALRPQGPDLSYRATGRPLPLPTERLAPVTASQFGGMLVGLRGQPVVVNVWASWCPPCRAEMPLLERASRAYAGRAVFLGVASKDSPGAALDFLDEVGVSYDNVFDATGDIRSELGLRGFPTTYVFDERGELVEAVVGGITEQRLAAQLDDLVS